MKFSSSDLNEAALNFQPVPSDKNFKVPTSSVMSSPSSLKTGVDNRIKLPTSVISMSKNNRDTLPDTGPKVIQRVRLPGNTFVQSRQSRSVLPTRLPKEPWRSSISPKSSTSSLHTGVDNRIKLPTSVISMSKNNRDTLPETGPKVIERVKLPGTTFVQARQSRSVLPTRLPEEPWGSLILPKANSEASIHRYHTDVNVDHEITRSTAFEMVCKEKFNQLTPLDILKKFEMSNPNVKVPYDSKEMADWLEYFKDLLCETRLFFLFGLKHDLIAVNLELQNYFSKL